MKQHKWHKEIKAWADGAMIESRAFDVMINQWSSWSYEENPKWYDHKLFEYQIKPQPKTPKQAWDEELTRSYKETIIERLRNDDKFYDEVFSAYDNAKDNEIKPQPKEPKYLYVLRRSGTSEYFLKPFPSDSTDVNNIGKIKMEDIELWQNHTSK